MEPTSSVTGTDLEFALLNRGPDSGPLALLLHGYPDSPESWLPVAERLAEAGYRVVAPWTRGYAPSGVPSSGSFHIGALAHDAIELHRLLGGDDRAVLVGHDWGAVAAHAVAGAADQPFRRIVTMAVPPLAAFGYRGDGTLPWLERLARQVGLSWYTLFQQLPVVSERALPRLVPHLWRVWSPGYPPGTELAAAWRAIASRRTAVLRYYRHAPRWWSTPEKFRPLRDGLRRPSTVPMLYLHGVQDGCVLAEWSAATRAVLPTGSRVAEVEGAGHFLQVERPDEVAALILDFLGPGQPRSE